MFGRRHLSLLPPTNMVDESAISPCGLRVPEQRQQAVVFSNFPLCRSIGLMLVLPGAKPDGVSRKMLIGTEPTGASAKATRGGGTPPTGRSDSMLAKELDGEPVEGQELHFDAVVLPGERPDGGETCNATRAKPGPVQGSGQSEEVTETGMTAIQTISRARFAQGAKAQRSAPR